jgi:hypothetical protein
MQVQVAAWLVLVQVKNKRKRSSSVRRPGVDKTSRLSLRDPVASGVNCGPHDGMNSKMKSWTVSWLSLNTKVELGLRGRRVMSGDWRRLHRVRRVCSGSPENHWVTRLSHKTEAEDSTRRCGHPGRSNRLGGAIWPPGWSNHPGGGLTALVAAAEKHQSRGHASGSHGLRRG